MEKVEIRNAEGYSAEVYHHGAHVTAWKDPSGKDLIFVSKDAVYKAPKAIRGGVPICFPQFGMMGPMACQHGFARNAAFEVEESSSSSVTMLLKYDGKGHESYPHPFELRSKVYLSGNSFVQELVVKNTGPSPMAFTTAMHTYLHVASATDASLVGLKGVRYLDNLQAQKEVVDEADCVEFKGEVDRAYIGAPSTLTLVDSTGGQVFEIKKHENLPDAVVWNPWIEKAKGMADFGDEEYKDMVCVETALAGSGAVTVGPGESWEASQTILVRKA